MNNSGKTVTKRPLRALAYLFALLILVFMGLYFWGTEDVKADGNVVSVSNAKVGTDFWGSKQVQYDVAPTRQTEPNINYRVVIDNGVWHWKYKMSWTQLELNIQKPQIIKDNITDGEYSAIIKKSNYSTTIYAPRKAHNVLWILFSLASVVGIVAVMRYKTYEYEQVGSGTIMPTESIKPAEPNPDDFYSVRSYCPHCDHCNKPSYRKNTQPQGKKIICGNCGIPYLHRYGHRDSGEVK